MRRGAVTWSMLVLATVGMLFPASGLSTPITMAHAMSNGLALTPPMGWEAWNHFGCNYNEQTIEQTADAMVASGMKDAGYQYVNITDCWMAHDRDANGNLQPDPTRFPDGVKAVADYVHSKGLKIGIYETAGGQTCMGYPGSFGHEQQDANTFAAWGIDYLKYDFCAPPNLTSAAPGFDFITVTDGSSYTSRYEAEAPENTLNGSAVVSACGCSGGYDVEGVGNNSGTLRFNNVYAPAPGAYQVTISYVNDNVSQRAYVSIDGGASTLVDFPIDYAYRSISSYTITTTLNAGNNTIEFYNSLSEQDNVELLYKRMHDALQATGRPIVFSICNWGVDQPWQWAPSLGNLWRTTSDIEDNWSSIMSILDKQSGLAPYAGPGQWNDPDMLEVGNGGMSTVEDQAHFSLWSILAAPLIAGNDVRSMSQATANILLNGEVIAVDQDAAGIEGSRILQDGEHEVWARPLANGDIAAVLLNRGDSGALISIDATRLGLPQAPAYSVRDLWAHTTTTSADAISAYVPPHGAAMFRVSTTTPAAPPSTVLSLTPTFFTATQMQAVTVTLTNNGTTALNGVTLTLQAPAGWSSSPVAAIGSSSSLLPGQSVQEVWNIALPAGTQPGSTATFSASAAYTYSGNPASIQMQTSVQVPPPPPTDDVYLSDAPWLSATAGSGSVQRDANIDGGALAMDGQTFSKGLGTHANSDITYYLGSTCSRFTADVGIDHEAGTNGSVVFQVWANGLKAYDSGPMTGTTPLQHIDIGIAGTATLRLSVTDGGDNMDGDDADWANARVSCGGTSSTATPPVPSLTPVPTTPLPLATDTPVPLATATSTPLALPTASATLAPLPPLATATVVRLAQAPVFSIATLPAPTVTSTTTPTARPTAAMRATPSSTRPALTLRLRLVNRTLPPNGALTIAVQTDPGASLQAWIDGVHKRHARLSLRRGAKGQWAVRINLDGHMPVGRLHLTIQARLGSVATRRVTDLQVVAKKHHLAPRVAAFVGLARHLASLVKPCNQAMSAVQSALHAHRPAAMRMAATRARRLVATCRTAWNRAKALPIAAVLRPYDSVHRLIDMIATAAHHASHTAGTITGGAPVPRTHDTRLRSQLANAVHVWRSDMARARSLALTISHHWHVSTRSVPAFT